MLKEIEIDLNNLSKEIYNKITQKKWAAAINSYEKLRNIFLKIKLVLQATLSLVSIASLQEKQGQIEKAENTIFRAAEEFESIKYNGYALRAYQRTLSLAQSLNKLDAVKIIQEKINSLGMLDLIIVTDATGSMGGALESIKKEITQMLYLLSNKIPGVRVGALAYRDHCDENQTFLIKAHPFMEQENYSELINFIKDWAPAGGGDAPEAIEDALNYLQKGYEWVSSKKIAVLITDAPPHTVSECPKNLDWKEEAKKLANDEIKIYTILCTTDDNTAKILKEIADLTQAEFFQLENIADLPDLVVAISLNQVELVGDFIIDLESKGQLTDTKKKLFEKISR